MTADAVSTPELAFTRLCPALCPGTGMAFGLAVGIADRHLSKSDGWIGTSESIIHARLTVTPPTCLNAQL